MGDIHRPGTVPLRSRVTFVALEYGTLHASGYSLVLERNTGTVTIPCGVATVLLLEPGITVTHAAVKLCADQGTLLIWCGEAGVHVYSAGLPGGPAGVRILEQARLRLHRNLRISVALRFYERMFGNAPSWSLDIEKLRGIEGAMVRGLYSRIASEHNVPWTSRETAPKALRDALGYATATLYGVAEAVILAAGYSPAIGFIHSGDRRSLVFDLADTIKFKTVVPAAFACFATRSADVRGDVRRCCRDLFRAEGVIEVLFENLLYALEPG